MNAFTERVNDTAQSEYLDRFYQETKIDKINGILYDCLIEYNLYRPHRSLNLLTPIEYCSKLLNKKDHSMMQRYRTQTKCLKNIDFLYKILYIICYILYINIFYQMYRYRVYRNN